jgi:hypothetical protein
LAPGVTKCPVQSRTVAKLVQKPGCRKIALETGYGACRSTLQPLERHRHIRSAIHQKSKAKHLDVNMFSLTNGAIGCPTVTDLAHSVLPRSIGVGVNYRNYLIFKDPKRSGVFLCNFPWMA